MKATKSIWARIMVLCLTVAMVLSVATMGAFAAPITSATQTGTITVIGSANDASADVTLYKIIRVNVADANGTFQPKDPMYTWNIDVVDWLTKNYPTYIDTTNGNAVTNTFATLSASELSTFYVALATAIKDNTITITNIDTEDYKEQKIYTGKLDDQTYSCTLTVEMGQYLVLATKGDYDYNPATATLAPTWGTNSWELNDVTVVLKGKGGIEKTVEPDGNGDVDLGYAVGDTVTYRLDVVIPVYPTDAVAKQFKVGDTMGEGLTFNGVETVKVYANNSANTYDKQNDLVPNEGNANYTVATVTKDGDPKVIVGFEINFTYDALKTAVGNATYVHVVYTATLNEKAFTTDDLGNTAYVGVNTNPYDGGSYETTTSEEDVYTYGMTVTKVDANDLVALLGAEFKLYSDDTCTKEIKFVGSDGVYTKALDQESAGVTLETNGLGQITLGGLDVGTYYLKEVKAPGGYQLPANPVTTITLTDGDGTTKADGVLDDGTTTATGATIVGEVNASGNTISFTIGNTKPGFELPTTGGMGTVAFTAGGLIIMACGAALVLVTLKKKKAEN